MDLKQIAHNLPNDKWKPLGRVLGLSEADLDNIVANPKYNDPVEQRYQMLLLWQHSKVEEATWELDEALRSEGVELSQLTRRYQTSKSKSGKHILCTTP